MVRTFQTVSLSILVSATMLVAPGYAALEADGDNMVDMAAVAVSDYQQVSGPVCIPPEPQYLSTFIRDMDGTIVGIRYDIIDYVC